MRDHPTWHAVITHHGSYAHTEIQAAITPAVTIQYWATPLAAADEATPWTLLVTADAADHGWKLPVWSSDQTTTTLEDIVPLDWRRVLTETTANRTRLQRELDQLEAAWQACILGARDLGQLPMAQIADAAGITRARIYQIQRAHKATSTPATTD